MTRSAALCCTEGHSVAQYSDVVCGAVHCAAVRFVLRSSMGCGAMWCGVVQCGDIGCKLWSAVQVCSTIL